MADDKNNSIKILEKAADRGVINFWIQKRDELKATLESITDEDIKTLREIDEYVIDSKVINVPSRVLSKREFVQFVENFVSDGNKVSLCVHNGSKLMFYPLRPKTEEEKKQDVLNMKKGKTNSVIEELNTRIKRLIAEYESKYRETLKITP